MSAPILRVPARLRPEARQFECYRALRLRYGDALQLQIYDHGQLEQIVVQQKGIPVVITIEEA